MLRNRPVSLGIDYFVNNLKDRQTSEIDVASGGFLKHKARSRIGENEKAILRVELYGPIGHDWVFNMLRGEYRAPEGIYSSNRDAIECDGKSNNSRIGIRVSESGRWMGLDM